MGGVKSCIGNTQVLQELELTYAACFAKPCCICGYRSMCRASEKTLNRSDFPPIGSIASMKEPQCKFNLSGACTVDGNYFFFGGGAAGEGTGWLDELFALGLEPLRSSLIGATGRGWGTCDPMVCSLRFCFSRSFTRVPDVICKRAGSLASLLLRRRGRWRRNWSGTDCGWWAAVKTCIGVSNPFFRSKSHMLGNSSFTITRQKSTHRDALLPRRGGLFRCVITH